MQEPNRAAAECYSDAGYQLLPLHRPEDTSEYKGKIRKDGKRPLHGNWTKRKYRNDDVLDIMDDGHNVGVRLKAEQLVIDVDPRNMPEGRDTFQELCEEIELDPDDYPVVRTGSGGLHVYMRKPADVKLVDSLEDFPGVEFKSEGRQVVSAGSVHPDTGDYYDWEFSLCDLGEEGMAPKTLIILARRPVIDTTSQGSGGEYDQEEVAIMLDALDPEDFQEQEKWLTLMQAVHHASGGDARSEFIEWSTRDPQYADDGWIIGRRWDSLHVQRDGGLVTYRTLHKYMRDAGGAATNAIIRPDDPDEDFGDDDDIDIPAGATHEKKGPLDRMNDEFLLVNDRGSVVIMGKETDPSTSRLYWNRWARQSFDLYLANRKILVPKGKEGELTPVPVSHEWYEWSKRRTAKGVVFDPEQDHEGFLNLWQGWQYQPKKGSWNHLKDLILNVLCDGNQEAYDYVYRWMAYMIQHPGRPAEVAIAFHGAKGTGKSTLGNILCKLAGNHGLAISSAGQLTGRFNSHLQDCLMLFADEAIRPHDKSAESMLKTLITEEWLAIEGKGQNIRTARNHIHLMLASNEEWFLPASFGDGERRFFVSRVNNSRQGDKAFFKALHREMDNGGYEAMLYDLSTFGLGDWVPRDNIPKTEALVEQQLRNMPPIAQWWFTILNAGDLDAIEAAPMRVLKIPRLLPGTEGTSWDLGAYVSISPKQMRQSFNAFCKYTGINPGANGRNIGDNFFKELRTVCPSLNEKERKITLTEELEDVGYELGASPGDRVVVREVPPLRQCRQEFEAIAGFNVNWGTDFDLDVEEDFG